MDMLSVSICGIVQYVVQKSYTMEFTFVQTAERKGILLIIIVSSVVIHLYKKSKKKRMTIFHFSDFSGLTKQ